MVKSNLDEFDVTKNLPLRLQTRIKCWQAKYEPVLNHRQKLLALWASGIFDGGYEREHLINLIDRTVSTLVPFLVEGNPKVLVETLIGNYRRWADTTQLAINFLLDKMNFADNTLIPAAVNSLFGDSIVRILFEYDRCISEENEQIKIGHPVVKVIDNADYVGDPSVKDRQDFAFEGDIYRLPTDYAKDLFSKYADHIQPDGRLYTKYAAEEITHPHFDHNKMALKQYTTFIDVYLKDENTICTIMPYGHKPVFLNEIKWKGPGNGPYNVLQYKTFPGSPISIPFTWAIHDLDVTENIVAKAGREQAESQKDIVFVDDEELGKKVLNAKNMDVMYHHNPTQGIQKISMGGQNPENYNYLQYIETMYARTGAGGNPVLRGSEEAAGTLGQEQMIFSNAVRVVNNMYNRFHTFMTSVIEKLAWGIWTDPTIYIPVIQKFPDFTPLERVFAKSDRVGDFFDFVFKIEPYSTQRSSPEMRWQKILLFMNQWVFPTMQLAAQQGASLDIPTVTKILANYLGIDNFNQYYKTVIPEQLDNVPYVMMQQSKKKSAQGNESVPMLPTEEQNLEQQQLGQASKPVEGAK